MLKRISALLICIAMLLSFTACEDNTSNSIATLNDENIAEEYFGFYFTQLKSTMQIQPGDTSWENATLEGKTALEYVKEKALQYVVEDKLIELKAKEEKIKLTSEDIKNMETVKQQWIDRYGSKESFVNEIKNTYGISEKQFDYMLEVVYYRDHVVNSYVKDEDVNVSEYYKNNIAKVKHILIPTVELETGEPLSADQLEVANSRLAELQDKISAGEDFDSLIPRYTQDQDAFYYVGKGFSLADDGSQGGSMVVEFEDAALTLGIGQISDVVESTYGYHIIKRYENDEDRFNLSKDTLMSVIKNEKFAGIMDNWRKDAKIVVNEEIYNSYR